MCPPPTIDLLRSLKERKSTLYYASQRGITFAPAANVDDGLGKRTTVIGITKDVGRSIIGEGGHIFIIIFMIRRHKNN